MLLVLAVPVHAQVPGRESGGMSEFTSGSPYSPRALDPNWSIRALAVVVSRYNRLNDPPPIFMTSLNFPGVYGSYVIGTTPISIFDRGPLFRADAALPGFTPPGEREAAFTVALGSARSAFVEVRLPVPEAELRFDDTRMPLSGSTRTYVTPPLLPGNYVYNIQAFWNAAGTPQTREKQVYIRPGDRIVVDLTSAPNEGPTLRTVPPPANLRVR
jgi:uncharacterized protein (TIGR03000 family)